MTTEKPTIIQAWREAYDDLKMKFSKPSVLYAYLMDGSYSQVVSEYRPEYEQWFGVFYFDTRDAFSAGRILDNLDNEMFTAFIAWAINDLQDEFEEAIKQADVGITDLSRHYGNYTNQETHNAFTMWKIGRGLK